MSARRAAFRSLPVFLAALLVAPLPALALSGTVHDEDDEPIEGAQVCYHVVGVDELCVKTNADGFFNLMDSSIDRIRVRADGYIPRVLPAVSPSEPIILARAATLLVHVVDVDTGEGIADATGTLSYPSGRLRRFVTNRAGARLRSLDPGRVRVTARAAGYLSSEPQAVRLVAGEEAELTIRLRADSSEQEPVEEEPTDPPVPER
jgi:hypothetical protein